ncbi:MAG: HXXEE domain-containing protein [Candidatus Limimorpha sp.]
MFMIHDFEEIIMFKPWLVKNRSEKKRRFSKLDTFFTKKRIYSLSTSGFAVAVLHEFVLISVITILSLWYENYHWWFAAFSAYFIHLLIHVRQLVIWRKYIPVILTSVISLPYCVYTLYV